MAHNQISFFTYRQDLDSGTHVVYLDQTPFGVELPSGTTIGAEVTFTSSGSVVGYCGIERWLMSWRLSATDEVSSYNADMYETRVGQAGGASGVLDSVEAISALGGAAFGFYFKPHAPGVDWTIRGIYWADDREGP
jgi:hypothetical protein